MATLASILNGIKFLLALAGIIKSGEKIYANEQQQKAGEAIQSNLDHAAVDANLAAARAIDDAVAHETEDQINKELAQ